MQAFHPGHTNGVCFELSDISVIKYLFSQVSYVYVPFSLGLIWENHDSDKNYIISTTNSSYLLLGSNFSEIGAHSYPLSLFPSNPLPSSCIPKF